MITFYTEEEYESLRRERDNLEEQLVEITRSKTIYASDPGAYINEVALKQLWNLLGAENQTQAIQRLKELKRVYL